jgi:hypothetical protein
MEMKRVRFADNEVLSVVVCEVNPRSELSQEDYNNMWFSADEYVNIMESCRLLSRQLQGSGRAKLLDSSLHELYDKHNGSEYDASQQLLIRWSRHCSSCRGLERRIHVVEGKKRRQAQRQSVRSVVEAQELDNDCSPNERAEKLRIVSEEKTEKARLFARKMGIADAAANFLELEQSLRWLYFSGKIPTNDVAMCSGGRDIQINVKCSPMA